MKFQATNVEYWSQNQVETVFFGNEEKELALLMSNVPGTSDHYLEWNDQSNAVVNGVEKIQLSGESLQIELSPQAAEKLGVDAFLVEFECEKAVFDEVFRCLKLIFQDKLLVKQEELKAKIAPKQDYSKIKYLNLEGKNLKQLPEHVAEMTALETVKLGANPKLDLQAAFEVLARLPNVKHLTFSTDSTIPDQIGQLAQLETLTINEITKPCTFPESIGQLKNLQYLLVMSDSDVVFPEPFAELTALAELYVRAASWQLPSKFYQLTRLKQLDFSNCRLHQVPEEMVQMTELGNVMFCSPDTRDYEQILSVIAQMPNIKVLEMSVNPVPKAIGLCKHLEEIVVWGGSDRENPLQLPDELFELKQLQTLLLNMSHLNQIPEGIGQLKGLKTLSFLESTFEYLPDSIGELSNLESLNINENAELKSLPESLGQLTQLTGLLLDGNPQLTALPISAKNLTNLKTVRLSNRETMKNVPESWNDLFTDF